MGHGAAQPQPVDVVGEPRRLERPDERRQALLRIGDAGGLVVDPVRVEIVGRVAGAARLGHGPLELQAHLLGELARVDRPLLQAVEQVVLDRSGEDVRLPADIGEIAAEHGVRQPGHLGLAQDDAAGMRLERPGENERQLLLARTRGAGDRDVLRQVELEAQAIEDGLALVVGERDVDGAKRPVELGRRLGLVQHQGLVAQAGRGELHHDLLVLDLHVVHRLIVGQELAPGRGQVLLGAHHGNEGAQRDLALDHEIAADREEEEGAQLGDEVVEELDQELLLVDVEADPEHLAQLLAEAAELERGRGVGADVAHAQGRLADPLGVAADLLDAQLAQLVHLPLQLGDQVHLQRIEGDRGEAQDRVLHEHEGQGRDQRAALEGRHGQRVADIAAQGLGLGVDHLDQLALADAAELGQREAEHMVVELIADAAQHPLGDDPGIDVQDVLQEPADQDQRQEHAAEHEEVVQLVQPVAQHLMGAAVPTERPVDDRLGQDEREVERRERQQRQAQDDQLLAPAVPRYVGEDRGFHSTSRRSLPGSEEPLE